MLDLGEIFATMQGVEVKIGGYSHPIFEFIQRERERVSAATDMSEEERGNRRQELADLQKLSMPYRRADTIPYVMERYVARLKSGKNYYSQRSLHWDSSTVR